MLVIRLSRTGKRHQPSYRLIVSEKTRDPWGKSLEILGDYNPRTKAAQLQTERIKHWLSKGAIASPTVHNLLINQGVTTGDKVRAGKTQPGKKKQAEAAGKAKAEAEAKKAAQAAEAAKQVEAEVKPADLPAEAPTPVEPVAATPVESVVEAPVESAPDVSNEAVQVEAKTE